MESECKGLERKREWVSKSEPLRSVVSGLVGGPLNQPTLILGSTATSGEDCATDDVRLELEGFLENLPGCFQRRGNFGFFTIRTLFRVSLKSALFMFFLQLLIFRLRLKRNLGAALLIPDGGRRLKSRP